MNKARREADLLEITIPSIRFLGMNEPLTLQLEKEYLKLAVRILVVWCTFLLFKDRMAKAWRTMFGDNDEARQKEISERIAKLEAERDRAKAAPGPAKKSYAVATGSAGDASASPSEKGGAKRRKA